MKLLPWALLALAPLLSPCAGIWCYEKQYSCDATCKDPSGWSSAFPRCGGLRQSPINIVSGKAHVDAALPPLEFIGHGDRINVTVENKGHSAHFHLPQSVRLSGGALQGHYRAAQFHFHWGAGGRPGSEHTVDGERFPMELHVVHVKEPYGSLSEAQHDMAGIALLAFLFEEAAEDHPHLDAVIAALGRVRHNGSTALMSDFRLSDMLPPSRELRGYYRYVGSMTTPGCEQAVAWTVFLKTLPVSARQLDAIARQCRFWTGQPMTDIFRPTQPLDGRVVYRSNSAGAVTPARRAAFWLVLAALLR
ncbi:carbonic anhydrase IV c isoform X2 [Hippocampus zosterae]|uniref:carbonic anhydrase IV c isoform X2 n=1 Tax=Hippocampus zosterae TaxID=109293 RepID=UPI00223E1AC6|nr:carbonic anhydrase IV c isoform X2 [Hippocampus zosterae]